ncbi:hypothetical protein EGR_10134 [Echinococcus granulosus]|uniref:Transmembrane protein n=1 Tax=Echinococcus granulosus TaxID=6210 RepID=W6U398_ECHGR|nr:hypothetical protein EGR_10134 [Echinococcus granulosus]EUB55016.1 hypothetical protein EGR_10134 [Echinococcus granulosus]
MAPCMWEEAGLQKSRNHLPPSSAFFTVGAAAVSVTAICFFFQTRTVIIHVVGTPTQSSSPLRYTAAVWNDRRHSVTPFSHPEVTANTSNYSCLVFCRCSRMAASAEELTALGVGMRQLGIGGVGVIEAWNHLETN